MLRSHWLRNVLEVARSRKDRRLLAARPRKLVRLTLESLEERLTPSGPQIAGSYTDLVNAVAADTATNTNYVIQITNSFTFSSGGQVNISKLGAGSTLSIEGQNGTNYTLTGNGNRLFMVGSGQNVTFKDLTLTGGIVDGSLTGIAEGGALLDAGGTVTISRVAVEKNKVTQGAAEGGGIYAGTGSTLTIRGGSTIRSNSAVNGTLSAPPHFDNSDYGGGIYVYGASTISISDSSISNNTAHGGQGYNATVAGENGGEGGQARGGGLYVAGLNWNVTLRGDTLSGNSATSGNGGNGAAGADAATANTTGGNGGDGGFGTEADGGGAYFVVRNDSGLGSGSGTLTILNDAENPSLIVNNSVQSGLSGNGGAGGTSTGTAANSTGGQGGPTDAGGAIGGGISFYSGGNPLNATIANTAIYGNEAIGGNGGTGGAAGRGGSGKAGAGGVNATGAFAWGGGIGLGGGNVTIVNSTIANNTATGGTGYSGQIGGKGGGINVGDDYGTVILENNTITQNTVTGSTTSGCGIAVVGGNPTLLNNLIQGNHSIGSGTPGLFAGLVTVTTPLSNASNNFIGSISANAVSTTTNIVGNSQPQLGNVVGVNSDGNPTGGPIYYPLLPGAVSIGAGNTSVLPTIASVEGTTSANATDEIGNPRSNHGLINLGAVEIPPAPLPPSPSPSPPPPSPPAPPVPPALNVPPLLALLDSLLGATETVNVDGTETITDSVFGIPLLVSTFDGNGNLVSVDLFGFDITFLFG